MPFKGAMLSPSGEHPGVGRPGRGASGGHASARSTGDEATTPAASLQRPGPSPRSPRQASSRAPAPSTCAGSPSTCSTASSSSGPGRTGGGRWTCRCRRRTPAATSPTASGTSWVSPASARGEPPKPAPPHAVRCVPLRHSAVSPVTYRAVGWDTKRRGKSCLARGRARGQVSGSVLVQAPSRPADLLPKSGSRNPAGQRVAGLGACIRCDV